MRHIVREVAEKAHEAVWFLALVAAVWIAKIIVHATLFEIALGFVLFLAVYVAYLFAGAFKNSRVRKVFPWLYSTSSTDFGRPLSEVESTIQNGSVVYVVTPDLHNDARENETINTIKKNLRRECSYIYVTKDNDARSKTNAAMVQKNLASYGNQVTIYITNEFFEHLPTYNILILERDQEGHLRVFVELPVAVHKNDQDVRVLWVEADSRLAERWHEKILRTLEDRKPIANPYLSSADSLAPSLSHEDKA